MATTTQIPRTERLSTWMSERNITYRALGEQLGMSAYGAHRMLHQEVMPTQRHTDCLRLGFPADLLPVPFDKKRGRRPKQPRFPGLVAAQEEQSCLQVVS